MAIVWISGFRRVGLVKALTAGLCAVVSLGLLEARSLAQLPPPTSIQPPSQPPAQTPTQSHFELGFVRSQLSDLGRFPLLFPGAQGELVGASDQLSPQQPSQPSLSWISEQIGERYGSDRLIEQWQAYRVNDSGARALNYVDVIVSEPIWSLLNYFERYAFIVQFGTAAKSHGYHLRVFHSGDVANLRDRRFDQAQNSSARLVRLRGAHLCSFPQSSTSADWPLAPTVAEGLPCAVELDAISGRPVQTSL